MGAILFKMISRSMIIIAMIITLLFFLIKRKKFHKKLTNREDAVLKVIATILVFIFLYKMFLLIILDIPCYRNSQFETITGYARDNACGKGNDRSVVIISMEDGHEEYVEFPYSKGIHKGDILTVKYLPHSKFGILICIGEEEENEECPFGLKTE